VEKIKLSGMEDSEATPISAEEAEQYDRQIRLWGVEAQKKCVVFRTLALFKCLLTYFWRVFQIE